MVRFGNIWNIATLSGGGVDDNNDPIPGTIDWKPFKCDAQPSDGYYAAGKDGDQINLSYRVWVMPNQGIILKRGGLVRDHDGIERIILQPEYNTFSV